MSTVLGLLLAEALAERRANGALCATVSLRDLGALTGLSEAEVLREIAGAAVSGQLKVTGVEIEGP